MQYPSFEYFTELKECLEKTFPQAHDWGNPKREKEALSIFADTYDVQLEALSVIKRVEVSHLLGMNEVVAPHLAMEYFELLPFLKELKKRYSKFNRLELMKEQIEKMLVSLGVENLIGYLHKDLEFLKENFDCGKDFDTKEIMTAAKKEVSKKSKN